MCLHRFVFEEGVSEEDEHCRHRHRRTHRTQLCVGVRTAHCGHGRGHVSRVVGWMVGGTDGGRDGQMDE